MGNAARTENMDPNDPLPRLLRLRGVVVRSVEEGEEVDSLSGPGLHDSYERLRDQVRGLAVERGIRLDDFDALFPKSAGELAQVPGNPRGALRNATVAKSAASLLRQLGGYLEGMIETAVIEQRVTTEQVAAAREAARKPPGFVTND